MERVTFKMYDDTIGYKTSPQSPLEVVGGSEVDDDMYIPYYVSFANIPSNPIEDYRCGGAVIEKNLVLSAEHCFDEKDGPISDIRAFIGHHSLSETKQDNAAEVIRVVVPANPLWRQDIALVELDTGDASTIPLISSTDRPLVDAVVIFGNGDTSYKKFGPQVSDRVKSVRLTQQPKRECVNAADYNNTFTCLTDGNNGIKDEEVNNIDKGDSGGPAVQIVMGEDGTITGVLRGIAVLSDPFPAPDYTVITDIKAIQISNFIKICSRSPQSHPEVCHIRYDRTAPNEAPLDSPLGVESGLLTLALMLHFSSQYFKS